MTRTEDDSEGLLNWWRHELVLRYRVNYTPIPLNKWGLLEYISTKRCILWRLPLWNKRANAIADINPFRFLPHRIQIQQYSTIQQNRSNIAWYRVESWDMIDWVALSDEYLPSEICQQLEMTMKSSNVSTSPPWRPFMIIQGYRPQHEEWQEGDCENLVLIITSSLKVHGSESRNKVWNTDNNLNIIRRPCLSMYYTSSSYLLHLAPASLWHYGLSSRSPLSHILLPWYSGSLSLFPGESTELLWRQPAIWTIL